MSSVGNVTCTYCFSHMIPLIFTFFNYDDICILFIIPKVNQSEKYHRCHWSFNWFWKQWLYTLTPYSSGTCCLLASLVKDIQSWKSLLWVYSLRPLQYCYHQQIYYILLISSCMSKGILKNAYQGQNLNSFEFMSWKFRKIFHKSCCDIIMNTI